MSDNPFGGASGDTQGGSQSTGGAWTPQSPPPPAKSRRGLIIGCSFALLVTVALCAGGIYWGYTQAHAAEDVVQAQATALGRSDSTAVCRHNSTRFQATMACDAYVTWLNTAAPFFAGSDVTLQGFNTTSSESQSVMVELTVQSQGSRGNGRLLFVLLREGGEWRVDGVRPVP